MSKNCFTDGISKLVAIATVAAVGVQGYYSVRHLIDINSEGSSSEAIQKWFRDQHCAKCMREQKRASTDIQRYWRGYRARSRNSSLRESLHEIHEQYKQKREQSTEKILPQLSEKGERETERSSAEEKQESVTSLGSSIRTGKTVSEKAVVEGPKESSLSLGSSKRSTKTLGASAEEKQSLNQASEKSVASGKSGLSTKGSKSAREETNHFISEEEQKSKITLASGIPEAETSSVEEKQASITSQGSSVHTGKTASQKSTVERPQTSSVSLGSSKHSNKTSEEKDVKVSSKESVVSGKSGLSTKGSKSAREETNHFVNEEEQKSKISLASGIPETKTSSVEEKQASITSQGSSVHTGQTASQKSTVERPQTSSVSLGSSKHSNKTSGAASEKKKDVKVSSKESVASEKSGISKTGTKSTIEEVDHSVNEQQKSQKSLASGISATEKQASVASLGSSVHTGKEASETILPGGQVVSNTSLGSSKHSNKNLNNSVEENQSSHESLILQDETLVEKNEQKSLKSLGHNSADETDALAEEQMSVKSFESKLSKNKET